MNLIKGFDDYPLRNCKAKEPNTVLESTLVEVEEKENKQDRLSLLPACPLPSAVYQASAAMDEEEEDEDVGRQDYEYVTQAYGAVTCSAKVTKHVARVKLPNSGLKWNEDCLVRFYIINYCWHIKSSDTRNNPS